MIQCFTSSSMSSLSLYKTGLAKLLLLSSSFLLIIASYFHIMQFRTFYFVFCTVAMQNQFSHITVTMQLILVDYCIILCNLGLYFQQSPFCPFLPFLHCYGAALLLQCSSAALLQCCIALVLQCSSAAVLQCCSALVL